MQRKFALWLQIVVVAAVGVMFFQVIQPFIFPLLLAGVVGILFRPWYLLLIPVFRGYRRPAALAATLSIFVSVMLPIGLALTLAGSELVELGNEVLQQVKPANHPNPAPADGWPGRWLADRVKPLLPDVGEEEIAQIRQAVAGGLQAVATELYDRTRGLLANLFKFVVGVVVMLLGVYYIFVDGPAFASLVRQFSPFETREEEELFRQFERISRGVILRTLLAALVQAAMAGIGFAVVGIERIWTLCLLTVLFAMIPFLGAAGVWVPVTLYLLVQQRWGAALFLGLYGGGGISLADNLIRPYVIHGQARLHPLIALVSILGALRLIGLWGVFIGPLVAAFFYALLKILYDRMRAEEATTPGQPPPALGGAG